MSVSPNYDKSIEFLKRFHPGRRWVLTSLAIDGAKPPTCTATFDEGRIDDCKAWLVAQGLSRNIYFSVAEVAMDVTKKAERTDIANVWYLHVDIDPRAGEDLAGEQARILKVLMSPHGKLPAPTVITYSGGGYQGFWALDKPIIIGQKLEAAEDAKLYNLKIELMLGADNCHNVDRIMRLPGTINRPDKKKLAKGRVEAVAEVINWQDSFMSISTFEKCLPPKKDLPSTDAGQPTTKAAPLPSNIQRFNSMDELPKGVSMKCKVVIVQGTDPDDPNKFPSRSEWLFFVCCGLVRGECTDDQIYSILTDPKFGISSSVLEKGNKAEKYAMRQIERARIEAASPELTAMNGRFAVIESIGGKCRIIEEQWDDGLKRHRIVKQAFKDFENRFMHIKVGMGFNDEGKEIAMPLGLWWQSRPHRRQFSRIVFSPAQDVSDAYNLWRGYGCDPKPGDCSLFLEHIRKVICSGNEEHYKYLLGWMAQGVQKPDRPGFSAIVLKGDQGTGKGLFVKTYGSLFGRHFMQVTDPKHLVGSFNAHLRDCVVLFGDEAFFAGDKKHESILKMIITEEMLTVEAKGVDAEQSGNYIHLLMASNDHWVVPAGVGDRRFFVLDVSRDHKEDEVYFTALDKEIRAGGREALLHYLMHYDLTGYDVRKIPKTKELQKQKMFSLPPEEKWWQEKLMEGRLLATHGIWETDIAFSTLYYDYIQHCRTTTSGFRKATKGSLKLMLRKYLPSGTLNEYAAAGNIEIIDIDGQMKMANQPMMVKFPSLKDCRDSWSVQFGGDIEWESLSNGLTGPDLYGDYR